MISQNIFLVIQKMGFYHPKVISLKQQCDIFKKDFDLPEKDFNNPKLANDIQRNISMTLKQQSDIPKKDFDDAEIAK